MFLLYFYIFSKLIVLFCAIKKQRSCQKGNRLQAGLGFVSCVHKNRVYNSYFQVNILSQSALITKMPKEWEYFFKKKLFPKMGKLL
jgi:hypothetical protein